MLKVGNQSKNSFSGLDHTNKDFQEVSQGGIEGFSTPQTCAYRKTCAYQNQTSN